MGALSLMAGETYRKPFEPVVPGAIYLVATGRWPQAIVLAAVFTIPANPSGVPAISIPSGVDEAGLPVGLQLTAPVLAEPTLLRVANALEAALGFDARPALIAA